MPASKTYLITGANRGLGRGLLEALIQRPDTTIVAGVRNPDDTSSKSLTSLPAATGSRVVVVAIESTDPSSAKKAVENISEKHGINKLDIVIASAGISKYYGLASVTPIEEVKEHFEVNTIGALILFQATLPLLTSSSGPIFVALSTGIGSIGEMGNLPLPATAYGISKVALNYLVRKIHFENPEITAFVISPGWVQTDMGNQGAKSSGMEEAPVTLEDSVNGMLTKIDHATREATSGTFQSFDDTKFPW
ncbi:hypothetical protein BGZ60DRAFT_366304 [Tricladium varicosporioides]|nr:hypothetical protein BGZ60DRAFT_366304 [Hymenoscyphus varicosporioides]